MQIQPAINVKALPLFHDLTEKEQSELMKMGRVKSLTKGELLFNHGDKLQSFFVVIDGAIRKFRQTPNGKEVTVNLVVRGELVGGSHIFETFKTYQWSASAAEHSTVIEFPIAWFKEQVKKQPGLALNLLSVLSESTNHAAIDAEHMITFTAAQRVACFLLRLCALYQLDPADFELPFNKTTIASKLGMELETFSRALGKLKEVGVAVKSAHISIQDFQALENYMCSQCSIEEDCMTLDRLHSCCGAKEGCAVRAVAQARQAARG